MSNSPEMQNIKNKVPLFENYQMKALSKIGTPAEQEIIGQFYNSTQEIVKNAINSFQGNKMRGEVDITRDMKVSDNDTWHTMIGKLQSAITYNEYNKKLSSLPADIMDNEHVNKKKALEMADKQLDGKKIRGDIYNRLHPQPTNEDIKHMAEKYKISEDEVKKKLRDKGFKV